MDFSERVKRMRAQADMTQADVAEALGLTPRAVGAWESGRSKPRLDKMRELADLFGVSVTELVDGVEPVGAVVPSSVLVPLLGVTHMGEKVDEETCDRMVEVPASVVEAHPAGYCVHADGSCMDNRYPDDCVLMVDPEMEPFPGCAVLAELDGYRSVVRAYSRGNTTLMLSADSHSGDYDDIVVRADDPPVVLKGVVVWYQAERDVRRR